MPRRLLVRRRPDSVREFREAARTRFDDGLCLAAGERRTGAIYLWGYSSEMILKAAFFSFLGKSETDTIRWDLDLRPAIDRGRLMRIAWPRQGAGHNVLAWGELLVRVRASLPGKAFEPRFARDVRRHGQRIDHLWRETLRYSKNVAYPHEVRQVREATEWFLVHSLHL